MKENNDFKVIISRDVVFDETTMPCRVVNVTGTGTGAEIENSKKGYELQFEVEAAENDHGINEHDIDPSDEPSQAQTTPDASGSENDENEENTITNSNQRLSATPGYLLTRNRAKRVRKPNPRYFHADIAAYALLSFQELSENEPKSYIEATKCKQSEKWKKAMEEEMISLHENKTWILVPKPKDQEIVDCK